MAEKFGIPIILLGALWGTFGVVLAAFNEVIKRRDKIYDTIYNKQIGHNQPSNKYNNENTPDHVSKDPLNITIKQRYLSDLLPMSLGLCLFLAIVSAILLYLPKFFDGETKQGYSNLVEHIGTLSIIAAILPIVCCLGFLVGMIIDYKDLRKYFEVKVY